MPTYEYECQKCGHSFEHFQSMKDEPLKRCPVCRSKVKRVFGVGAGILFKGSGFYATDYRSSSYSAAAKSESQSSDAAKPAATADKSAKTEAPAGGSASSTKKED